MKKNILLITVFFSFHFLYGQSIDKNPVNIKAEPANSSKKSKKNRIEKKENTTLTTTPSASPPVNNPKTIKGQQEVGNVKVPTPPTVASSEVDFSVFEKYIEPIVEERANGQINWTQQFVEAKGQSVIDLERFKNPAQAKAMATRGAVVVAQRNLLEIVKGVHVVGETTVENMAVTRDYIFTKVEGLVKGAQQVGPALEKDGMIEVTLKMPLYGNEGIASAIQEKDIENAHIKMGLKPLSSLQTENVLPEINSNNETIDGSKPFVFNFKGKKIDPSMFPVVVDENGKVEFDFSKIYDTKNGKFPQFAQLSKEIAQDLGFKQTVEVIDLIQNAKGQFTIPANQKKKIFWQKLGNVMQKVGRVVFSIL